MDQVMDQVVSPPQASRSYGHEAGMGQEGCDRVYQALLFLQAGLPLDEIARRLPNRTRRAEGTQGVGLHAAEIIIRSGLRSLNTHVLLDRCPDSLPAALWPPAAVREAVRSEPRGGYGRAPLRLLRAWLEGGLDETGHPRRAGAETGPRSPLV